MDSHRYYTGLDLGQASDYTALAVLEQSRRAPDPRRPDDTLSYYLVRHLERLPLGTPYPAVCARLKELYSGPPLAGSVLAVDRTGVGRAVYDEVRALDLKETRTYGITITAGGTVTGGPAGYNVPKRDLVGVLQVLLQQRRLQVSAHLPECSTLVRELSTFKVKVTQAANETYEAWRESDHDDLVLAVAVAAWVAERRPRQIGLLGG